MAIFAPTYPLDYVHYSMHDYHSLMSKIYSISSTHSLKKFFSTYITILLLPLYIDQLFFIERIFLVILLETLYLKVCYWAPWVRKVLVIPWLLQLNISHFISYLTFWTITYLINYYIAKLYPFFSTYLISFFFFSQKILYQLLDLLLICWPLFLGHFVFARIV